MGHSIPTHVVPNEYVDNEIKRISDELSMIFATHDTRLTAPLALQYAAAFYAQLHSAGMLSTNELAQTFSIALSRALEKIENVEIGALPASHYVPPGTKPN